MPCLVFGSSSEPSEGESSSSSPSSEGGEALVGLEGRCFGLVDALGESSPAAVASSARRFFSFSARRAASWMRAREGGMARGAGTAEGDLSSDLWGEVGSVDAVSRVVVSRLRGPRPPVAASVALVGLVDDVGFSSDDDSWIGSSSCVDSKTVK